MSTRNDYVEQLKQNLDKWNADLGKLEEKAKVAQTDMRIDYEMQLEALRKHREAATARLKELQASGEEVWTELTAGADAAWDAMRDAFSKAATHFQKDAPDDKEST